MNNIKKCEIATYPISFKANITKTVLNNLSNNSSIDKTLKLASASALAYWTALVSTKNNTENIDRIGSGIDNIYIKNMSKEKRSWKKEMEPLEEFTKEEYEILLPDVLNINNYISKFNQNIIYPKCPDKYLGLLPYCGLYDFSSQINE